MRYAGTFSGITVNLEPVGHRTQDRCAGAATRVVVTGGTGIFMDTLDNSFCRDRVAATYSTTCGRYEVGGQVSGVSAAPIEMTVQTADGHTSLDDALDTWISSPQGAGVSGVGSGGVMAQGAIARMKSKNAIRAGPGGGELRCI